MIIEEPGAANREPCTSNDDAHELLQRTNNARPQQVE
jgi:hypothetical protein